MTKQNNTPPGPPLQPHDPRQQLAELVAEARKNTGIRRDTHIGGLLDMVYNSLRAAEKEAFLDCLERIIKGEDIKCGKN